MEKPNQTINLAKNGLVIYWGSQHQQGIVGSWFVVMDKLYFKCVKSWLLEFRASTTKDFVKSIKRHIGVTD